MNQNNFCALPWVSIHTWANGNMFPCCKSDPMISFGKLDTSKSYKDNINNKSFINLRQEFLENRQPKSCWKCFEEESKGIRSMRIDQNNYYKEYLESDYFKNNYIQKPKIFYLDMRSSNKCNLCCVMCSPEFSHKIYDIYKNLDMYTDNIQFKSFSYYEQLQPYVNEIKTFYLAGGEPFLDENILNILDMLDENSEIKTIIFTTNCTIDLNKSKLFDILKKIEKHNVNLRISLDGNKEYNEKIRLGSDYDQIIKNILFLKENFPNFDLVINPTIGTLNVEHFNLFYNELLYLNLKWDLNFIQFPDYFNIINLPQDLKDSIINKFKNQNPILDQIVYFLQSNGNPLKYNEGLEFYNKFYKEYVEIYK